MRFILILALTLGLFLNGESGEVMLALLNQFFSSLPFMLLTTLLISVGVTTTAHSLSNNYLVSILLGIGTQYVLMFHVLPIN